MSLEINVWLLIYEEVLLKVLDVYRKIEIFKKVMIMEEGIELLFIIDGYYISLCFCIFVV